MAVFNGTTRTAKDLMTRVKRAFGDEAAVQITDNDLFAWINDGQREIARENPITRMIGTADAVKGQQDYPLTGLPILSIQSVRYNGKPLKFLNFQEAEDKFAGIPGDVSQGSPEYWYNFGGDISVFPTPDTTAAGAIKIHYTAVPADISNLSDKLSVPDIYFTTLYQYVMGQAHDLDEDYDASSRKKGEFSQSMKVLSEQESYSNNDAYPVITISPEDM